MTIATLIFFAVLGVVAGGVEHYMRWSNQQQNITTPLDHGKLVEYRVIAGVCWMFIAFLQQLFSKELSWLILLYIPMGMGAFGAFHRLTINYAADRGPWYLGVDSWIDQQALKAAGMVYIYPSSAAHFEAWDSSTPYRKVVRNAAMGLYFVELAVAVAAAYITL
jgi:hypothetical protein